LRSLVAQYAPRKPWCANEKNLAQVRPLATALGRPYIQMSNPAMACWLIFDIDRGSAANAWEDANLPPPTYVATNRENGHAHLGYALAAPVCMTAFGRRRPQRYLAAIEHAYIERLRADRAFNGPLAKNPLHEQWTVWEPAANCPQYELGHLADYVHLPSSLPQRVKSEGYSRNCDLFEALSGWAYRAIREYWRPGREEHWRQICLNQAEASNRFLVPLGANEVKSIARSVSRWTWRHITPVGFQEVQAKRGHFGGLKSGAARRLASASKREQAHFLGEQGLSNREIARRLGISHPTVASWLSGAGGK
jgi:hypothetical protein